MTSKITPQNQLYQIMESFLRVVKPDSVEDHIKEDRLKFFTSKFIIHSAVCSSPHTHLQRSGIILAYISKNYLLSALKNVILWSKNTTVISILNFKCQVKFICCLFFFFWDFCCCCQLLLLLLLKKRFRFFVFRNCSNSN